MDWTPEFVSNTYLYTSCLRGFNSVVFTAKFLSYTVDSVSWNYTLRKPYAANFVRQTADSDSHETRALASCRHEARALASCRHETLILASPVVSGAVVRAAAEW